MSQRYAKKKIAGRSIARGACSVTAEERRTELIVHATLLLVLSVVLMFAVWWLAWWAQPPTEEPVTPMTVAPPIPYNEEP